MLTVSFYCIFYFLPNYDLSFLNTAAIAQIFNSTAQLAVPLGIQIRVAKPENGTQLLTVEFNISYFSM